MKKILLLAAAALVISESSAVVHAVSSFLTSFRSTYGIANTTANPLNSCVLCHPAGGGNDGGNLNGYSSDYRDANFSFVAIQNLDSDGDGFTNLAEISAQTFPGDAASHPAPSDTTAPVVTAFSIPATSASLTLTITTLTATDAVGVTGYLVTESSTTPSASATGWSATRPASYTFSSAGSKTLYAWAKDAATNVSAPRSAATTITLPDTVAPIVTAFSIPSASASLTLTITTLTASDAAGVTGYLVTESSTPPSASAAGWSATRPASYTFSSAGSKTLYAWAKDAAGNVSAPLSAATTITLPDTVAPVVTAFSIPAASASLTLTITTLTASDAVGVTGYLVTESSTPPSASAAGWSATRPTSFTFSSAGSKTLYAWAKDAAGNVSAPRSAATTITLPDTVAPVVTAFSIPAASASLTLTITTLTASDAAGVTGYLLTESSTTPSVSAAGWSATPPASYTFSSAGSKTLYAWAKDAAGNVSAPRSAATTITLPDTVAPVVTAFSMPSASASLTLTITTLTASDAAGVTGYLLTESSTTPSVSAAGWSATPPASYTFSSAGSKTLYAWAKDAAGNVSAPRSAATTITLPDMVAPTVTAFGIEPSTSSLTVNILAFSATDDSGVAGYMVTESGTIPGPGDAGWTSTPPSSHTFASAGNHVLYAWAKDAAGNVSVPASDSTTITPSDSVAPMIVSFEIPPTSDSLVVPVTALSATDDTGVAGYLLTESSGTPLSASPEWSATAPTSHTFSSAGNKTLYAWAKDAAGNVSDPASAVVSLLLEDWTPPEVTAFAMPERSSTLTVSITTFTAVDDQGVTGYVVTETSTAPDVSAPEWMGTAPTSTTFSSAGTKTLYAWAKDAAGNVSASRQRTVVVDLSDWRRPEVTRFEIPEWSSSLTVPIRAFVATDNVGVTGYILTESYYRPRASSSGWRSTPPTSYTFTRSGERTLYAWAKDAAGNVSESRRRTVRIRVSSYYDHDDDDEHDDDEHDD